MSPRAESQPSMRQNVISQCSVLHLPTVASQCLPLAWRSQPNASVSHT
jgi:hypothetical protein